MGTSQTPTKPQSNIYFTADTESAIIAYNKSIDPLERELLFRSKIHGPLDKLAENVINRFKFPYMEGTFDEIKSEVVSFLVLNLHKFTENKGKAFSYLSVIAKNYLILHNSNSYKEDKRFLYLSDYAEDAFPNEEVLLVEQDSVLAGAMDTTGEVDNKEFLILLSDYLELNINRLFKKQRDREIAYAVVSLLDNADRIEIFNKKALYMMIREITNYKTSHITKVINKLRPIVVELLLEYKTYGHLSNETDYLTFKK